MVDKYDVKISCGYPFEEAIKGLNDPAFRIDKDLSITGHVALSDVEDIAKDLALSTGIRLWDMQLKIRNRGFMAYDLFSADSASAFVYLNDELTSAFYYPSCCYENENIVKYNKEKLKELTEGFSYRKQK